MRKDGILVVSFGTSYTEAREASILPIIELLKKEAPGVPIFESYTSGMIRKKILERDSVDIKDVEGSLREMAKKGITHVKVLPTHVIPGYEYDKMESQIRAMEEAFTEVLTAPPLLGEEKDYQDVVEALLADGVQEHNADSAYIFMGHGTEHQANDAYQRLEKEFQKKGFHQVHISTVEGMPEIEATLKFIEEKEYAHLTLQPFLFVAGDHARNDMAGDEDDSWKNRFQKAGYQVTTVIRGLGEIPGIQEIYLNHYRALQ